jgi:hypothetical protein
VIQIENYGGGHQKTAEMNIGFACLARNFGLALTAVEA